MDTTPTGLFDSYDADFQSLLDSVKQKLDVDVKNQVGEQRKATLRKVEIETDEAEDIVSQLEVEVQGIPVSVRSPYATRLKKNKADILRYKKAAKDLQAQTARSDLIGGGNKRFAANSDDPYGERSDRMRLLAGTDTLEDGSRRIQDSTRIALETEDVGADTLRELRRQREQIENARDTLHTADTSIDRAGTTIKTMIRQMYKQRFILGILIMVLIVVVVLILYFKLIRRR